MKLERLSENQIRCTLDKTDLADRELLLDELAYGTDKAKELFHDMMEQASEELGFEANDIPLMIEAIPVSPECLILIITKVDDPEELDTRFSRLSKYANLNLDNTSDRDKNISEEDEDSLKVFNENSSLIDTISDIVENIEQVKKQTESSKSPTFVPLSAALRENVAKKKAEKEKNNSKKQKQITPYRIFAFHNMNDITKAASMIVPMFNDESSLYKSPLDNQYYLIVKNKTNTVEDYQRVCNILSEYGTKVKTNYAAPYYYSEHYKLLIKKNAIQTLATI